MRKTNEVVIVQTKATCQQVATEEAGFKFSASEMSQFFESNEFVCQKINEDGKRYRNSMTQRPGDINV